MNPNSRIFYFVLIFFTFTTITQGNTKTPSPNVRIVDIWAYGDIVTDSATLDYKQNNLRFYCATKENIPHRQLDYLFMLEGYDKEWFTPFFDGWYFYTDLPPGDYVFHAKCRLKGKQWGTEVSHSFKIICPWWRTWWAKLCYILLAMAVFTYILYLLRERIHLHNRLRVEEETKRFRNDFILQVARGFNAPLSIIRSIAEKQKLNISHPLSKTDIQHLRNSSRQMMEMAENLIEFHPNTTHTDYFAADDVMEMRDIPLNSHKILVVEHDASLADVIERDLLRIFKVMRCAGNEVLTAVEKEKPDAVVIDTNIQDANPFELPKLIKNKTFTVIILLSDFITTKDLLRAVRSEADDFVRKPFNSQYLTALIVKRIKDAAKYGEEIANVHVRELPVSTKTEHCGSTANLIETHSDKLFLEQLEVAVNTNLSSTSFNVNVLARIMKMSRAQLNIMTKKTTRMSPSEYIRNRRLITAAGLIEKTNQTIQEIMFHVGMTDANYFYRRFKEKYGVTPNAYRKG